MKKHIAGTNNRTVCGNKINENTQLISKYEIKFDVTCDRCIQRTSESDGYNLFLLCQKLITEVKFYGEEYNYRCMNLERSDTLIEEDRGIRARKVLRDNKICDMRDKWGDK